MLARRKRSDNSISRQTKGLYLVSSPQIKCSFRLPSRDGQGSDRELFRHIKGSGMEPSRHLKDLDMEQPRRLKGSVVLSRRAKDTAKDSRVLSLSRRLKGSVVPSRRTKDTGIRLASNETLITALAMIIDMKEAVDPALEETLMEGIIDTVVAVTTAEPAREIVVVVVTTAETVTGVIIAVVTITDTAMRVMVVEGKSSNNSVLGNS